MAFADVDDQERRPAHQHATSSAVELKPVPPVGQVVPQEGPVAVGVKEELVTAKLWANQPTVRAATARLGNKSSVLSQQELAATQQALRSYLQPLVSSRGYLGFVLLGADGDVIKGRIGNDIIYGGEGEDFIQGDEGNDILSGGARSDLFFFSGLFGNDIITDFDDIQDGLIFEGTDNITAEEVANGTLLTVESEFTNGSVLLLGVFDLNEIA